MISAYLKLVTEAASAVKGPVRDRDNARDGSIALLSIEHSIVSPRHPATGLATGKRQHLPISFTKDTDNTSPLFYQWIARNELIKTAEFFFFGPGAQSGLLAGRESIQYKITLKKAWVAKIELLGHTDTAAQDNRQFPLIEKISLVYDAIAWEWLNPKMTADDTYSSLQ